MSTWMINGPGQALYIGNRNVSQFDPSGQTSPGQGYIPDEVAKMLVKEAGLRKESTVSKRVIVGYLESMGLSAGLATDVAMVLRNVYGVTPTFDESATLFNRSAALVEELMGVVKESYPAPFRFDEPEVLNEMDEVREYILREYLESRDDVYDVVLEHLAEMDSHDVLDIVEFYEWVGPTGFNYLADLVEHGPDGLADEVLEGICHPEMVMSEDVQFHISEINIPDVKPLPKDQQDALKKKRDAGMKMQRNKPVSARTQLKRAYRDAHGGEGGDVLKQRKAAADRTKTPAMKGMSKAEVGARRDALKDRASERQKVRDSHTSAGLQKAASAGAAEYHKGQAEKSAARKEKGKKALGLMKKVAAAPFKAAASVGGAVGKAALKATGKVAGLAARGVGHLAGQAAAGAKKSYQARAQTAHSGDGGASASASSSKSKKGGQQQSAPEAKPGIAHKIGSAIGRFASGLKAGYKAHTPGIQSQMKGGEKEKEKASSGPKPGDTASAAGGVRESVARQGELLSEMSQIFSGNTAPMIPEPVDVLSRLESRDIVGQAVIEALSQLSWDEVSQIASVSMLPANDSYALVMAYQEGRDSFFHEWRDVASRVAIPAPLTKESFTLLGSLSMDESIVPKLVGYALEAIRFAGPDVAQCIEDAYPELGKTVYGPAGDPNEGPSLAKKYMSPYPCGTDLPMRGNEVMTTRMFSDPDERAKSRKSKLSGVMDVLHGMHQAADASGVDPEGMFLNTYRDLHRERVRYS